MYSIKEWTLLAESVHSLTFIKMCIHNEMQFAMFEMQ